jgi:hypothetical protein
MWFPKVAVHEPSVDTGTTKDASVAAKRSFTCDRSPFNLD